MRVPESKNFSSDSMGKKRHKLNKKDLERSRCDSSDDSVNNTGKKTVGAASNEKDEKCRKEMIMNLPSVKGLTNLGNTCFFNAVLQVLCQTEELENILSTQCKKGAVLHLPATRGKEENDDDRLSDEEDRVDDDVDDDDDEEDSDDTELYSNLLPITLTLPEGGAMAQALASVLNDMKTTRNGSISPSTLFRQVCKKTPQFKGAQQQDSHELLRHLLDGMKVEEIRRSQASILKHFNLPQNVNPKNVPEDVKQKLKASGRLAKSNTFVDKLFGGYLISTVVCEECNIASHVFEPFLDLSLPISEEKPSRSLPIHKKDTSGGGSVEQSIISSSVKDDISDKYTAPISKHKEKMARKNAKKEAKLARRKARQKSVSLTEKVDEADDKEEADDREEINDKEEAENSDDKNIEDDEQSESDDGEHEQTGFADVEDNTESDTSRRFSLTGECLVKPSSLIAVDETDNDNQLQTVEKKTDDENERSSSNSNEKPLINGTLEETIDGEIQAESNHSQTPGAGLCEKLSHLHLDEPKDTSKEIICNGDVLVESTDDSINTSQQQQQQAGLNDNNSSNCIERDDDDEENEEVNYKLCNSTNDAAPTDDKHENNQQQQQQQQQQKKPNSRQEAIKQSMSTLAPRSQSIGSECSIESCLRQFTSPELLTGNNKFGCELCTKQKYPDKNQKGYHTVYTNASKQILLYSLPPVLTLHLKRFQQVGYSLRKVNRHVNFPLVMDIAAYCSSMAQGVQDTKVLYGLYGIVEHSGRLSGGHYTAYVRVRPKSERSKQYLQRTLRMKLTLPARKFDLKNSSQTDDCKIKNIVQTGRWFHISDTCVREVSESTVLKCQAYLLFYERIL